MGLAGAAGTHEGGDFVGEDFVAAQDMPTLAVVFAIEPGPDEAAGGFVVEGQAEAAPSHLPPRVMQPISMRSGSSPGQVKPYLT